MKILMFGRGTIATVYGWALTRAGHTVDFYVRPGRAAQYGPTVALDLVDSRVRGPGRVVKEDWPVRLREEWTVDHDYDLVFVSVAHGSVEAALRFVAPRLGRATVLVFNNVWTAPEQAIVPLPVDQVVWGFPGAGGGFNEAGALRAGLLNTVILGTLATEATDRHRAVKQLFLSAGFRVSEQRHFRDWLWHHFVLDAAVAIEVLKVGGMKPFADSPEAFRGLVLNVRELLPLLKARGCRLSPLATLPFALPAGLVAWLMTRALGPGSVAREVVVRGAESPTTSGEMAVYVRDTLAEARRLGVRVPRLEEVEPLVGPYSPRG